MKFILNFLFIICATTIYGQSPNWQWAQTAGGSGSDNVSGIATDNIGNSFVCGYYFSSQITIGTTTLVNNGNYDFYVAKYNNAGIALWAKSFGGSFDDNATSITRDNLGNCYVTGYFISPVMVCGTTTLINSGAGDMFIVKLDANGNVLWAINEGNGGNNVANSITTDVSGNIFVAGFFNNSILTFGTYTLSSNGNDDAFLVKYDNSANVIWAVSFGSNLAESANGVVTDITGDAYVTGFFKSANLTAGTNTLINNSVASADIFLLKISKTGTIIASTSIGDAFDEIGYGITVDGVGDIILTGSFMSPTLTVGTSTLNNFGNRDVIVAKFDSNCNSVWAKGGGGSFDDYGYGIVADVTGNIFVNGHIHSFMGTFGTNTISIGGVGDGFLTAYDASGNNLFADAFGGNNDDGWNCLSADGAGNIYAGGYFSSNGVSLGTNNLAYIGQADIVVGKLNASNEIASHQVQSSAIVVFPNPSNGNFKIRNESLSNTTKLEIVDLTGRLVYQTDMTVATQEINLSNYAKGIYFLRIINNNTIISKKLIIE